MLKLGVNIDHVATVRQARKAELPDPFEAAKVCIKAGAVQITAHLREDRRHIQDADMIKLCAKIKIVNMEMAVTSEMVKIASKLKPHSSCLVPEKRQELTTEGGLDVAGNLKYIKDAVKKLQKQGILVSLFIDPVSEQIKAAADSGAEFIEMHTGSYANASGAAQKKELARLVDGAKLAHKLGLKVNAGHGIDYKNIKGILTIPHLVELNIGHSIIARAVMVGMHQAVAEMVKLMSKYKSK